MDSFSLVAFLFFVPFDDAPTLFFDGDYRGLLAVVTGFWGFKCVSSPFSPFFYYDV